MYHDPRCIECLMSRVSLECSLVDADVIKTESIMESAREYLSFLHKTPYSHPMIASILHRYVYGKLGTRDPFIDLKIQSNHDAKNVIDKHEGHFSSFHDVVLASVIGNMFDYGVKGHEVRKDFSTFFEEEFHSGLFTDDTDQILPLTGRVVYFTDNCGEILFDQVLIRYLKEYGSYITLVVRDGPILNDATIEDAHALGLEREVDQIVTCGAGSEIGIRFDLIPSTLQDAIDNCSLIISKGMANYESLREFEGLPPVAYLLAAKCDPIAEELQVPRGSKLALLRNIR